MPEATATTLDIVNPRPDGQTRSFYQTPALKDMRILVPEEA